MRRRPRAEHPKRAAKEQGSLSDDRPLTTALMLGYIVLTGAALLAVSVLPEVASQSFAMGVANAVAKIFPVVANTQNCGAQLPERAFLVAVLVPAVHILVGGIIGPHAWHRREKDDAEPLRRPTLWECISVLAQYLFVVGLYWFTFFSMGVPGPGTPSSASYLCWDLWIVWLLFTVQGIFCVGIACVFVVMTRSVATRVLKHHLNRS